MKTLYVTLKRVSVSDSDTLQTFKHCDNIVGNQSGNVFSVSVCLKVAETCCHGNLRCLSVPPLQTYNMLMFAILLFQLAPSLPLQEDFVYHWKAITHYYIETSGKRSLEE